MELRRHLMPPAPASTAAPADLLRRYLAREPGDGGAAGPAAGPRLDNPLSTARGLSSHIATNGLRSETWPAAETQSWLVMFTSLRPTSRLGRKPAPRSHAFGS